jgi:c(7)-type cytochrome triheme protein
MKKQKSDKPQRHRGAEKRNKLKNLRVSVPLWQIIIISLLLAGFMDIPFYEDGSLASTEADDIEKRKKEFEIQAKARFEGDFWMPPQKDPQLPPALKGLPKDAFGYPDWTAAVKLGIIEPIDSLSGQELKKEEEFNEDIIFEINDKMMANVIFSHRIHNYWFSCKVCHPAIFKPQKGANSFKMKDNWNGNYCGRCHGKVAYAPKGFENCIRCHSANSAKG